MDRPVTPFVVQPDERPWAPVPTGTARVRADSGSTGGVLTVMEFDIAPGSGPALHTHRDDDEVWYVLAGDFRFKAGDALFHTSTGGLAFGPRGVPHAFQNIGNGPGRLLVVTAPGGLERVFAHFGARPPGPGELADLAAAGHAHGIEIVGPPLDASDARPERVHPGPDVST